jgi:hypothetical protein
VPIALAESWIALAVALAFVGLSNGLLDLAMNVHGLTVERRLGRPILATLHASFSFGALAGAAAGGAIAGSGVPVTSHLPATAGVGVAVALVCARFLLPRSADAAPTGPLFAMPSRALAALGAFAFCALLSEGAVNDWAAVYIDGDLDAGEGVAALGLAAFSLTMGIGRLTGDRLTQALGPRRLARAGAALATGGVAAAVAAPTPALAIAGFAAMGLGLAALFPLALRAASAHAGAPAVAAVSAVGYAGFLAGPPLVGGLAELGGLRLGLALTAALCLLAAALARAVRVPVAA